MKVQSINLAFGKRSKPKAGENGPNVFGLTTFGIATGAISGQLARNYFPVSDEFFQGVSNDNPVQKSMSQFIQDYALSEIQDARVLKTALTVVRADIETILPELKNKGISDLMNEPEIKIIDKNDSEELNNALKVLNADLLKDLAIKDKNELLNQFENTSDMASSLFVKAKKGILVKEHLKGLSVNGLEAIKGAKSKIQNNKECSKEIQNEVFSAFENMLQAAKVSQRPPSLWVAIPSVVVGFSSMVWAVNRKMILENKKGTLK